MELDEENSTVLLRILRKAARAAWTIARLHPSSSPAPATPYYGSPPGLLDCTDDDGASFHTAPSASSTPPGETKPGSSGSPAGDADIDSRAAEFIERFRRNASLELRYCSPVTPVRPPISPDSYFNLYRMYRATAPPVRAPPAVPVAVAVGRARGSAMSIKWPSRTSLRPRPTVQV